MSRLSATADVLEHFAVWTWCGWCAKLQTENSQLEFMTEGSGHAEVLCVDRVSVPYRVPDRVGLLLSNSSPMAYPDDFQVK